MGGVVRRYIDILTIIINFPYSTCISSFLAAASFLKCFFVLVYIYTREMRQPTRVKGSLLSQLYLTVL